MLFSNVVPSGHACEHLSRLNVRGFLGPRRDHFTTAKIQKTTQPAFETFSCCCHSNIQHMSALNPVRSHHVERVARVLPLEPATRTHRKEIRCAIRVSHDQIDAWTLSHAGAASPTELIYGDWLRETIQAYSVDL